MGLFDFLKGRSASARDESKDADSAFSRELDALINQLQNASRAQDRGFTAQRIGARGSRAAKAIPALLNVLQNDTGADARTGVAGALGDIGVGTAQVVGALMKAAQHDTEDDVRLNAIISLGQLGPNAKTAIPLLKSIASDSNVSQEIRFKARINAKILEQE